MKDKPELSRQKACVCVCVCEGEGEVIRGEREEMEVDMLHLQILT